MPFTSTPMTLAGIDNTRGHIQKQNVTTTGVQLYEARVDRLFAEDSGDGYVDIMDKLRIDGTAESINGVKFLLKGTAADAAANAGAGQDIFQVVDDNDAPIFGIRPSDNDAPGVVEVYGDLKVDGDETVVGNTVFEGNTQIGDAGSDTLDVQASIISNLVPEGTRTLGTAAAEWAKLFLGDGAQADATLQIGADQDVLAGWHNTNNIFYLETKDYAAGAVPTGGITIATGDIITAATGSAGDIAITAGAVSNGDGDAGSITLTTNVASGAGANGDIDLTSAGEINLTATGGIDILSATNLTATMTVGTTGDILFTRAGSDGTLTMPQTGSGAAPVAGEVRVNSSNQLQWSDGAGSWLTAGTSTGNSLQEAYAAGREIITDTTDDNIFFTLGENYTGPDDGSSFIVRAGPAPAYSDYVEFRRTADNVMSFLAEVEIIDFNANGAVTVDSATAGISLDAAAASNFTTSAGALTLDGNGGVNIAGNAAEVDITTSGAVDINSGAGTWDGSSLAFATTAGTGTSITTLSETNTSISTRNQAVALSPSGDINLTTGNNTFATGTNASGVIKLETGDVTSGNVGHISFDLGVSAAGGSDAAVRFQYNGASFAEFDSEAKSFNFRKIADTWALQLPDTDTDTVVAANYTGAITFDGTKGELLYSDGANWLSVGEGVTTLQEAYTGSAAEAQPMITVLNGDDLSFYLFDIGATFKVYDADDASAFVITKTASVAISADVSGAISLDAGGASNFTVDSNSLTLSTTTSGAIDVQAVGAVTVDSSGSTIGIGTDANTGAINIGTSATARTITVGNAASTAVDIDAIAVTIDGAAGGVSIGGGTASDFTTTAGALTLDGNGGVNIAGNAAEIDITTSGAVDINSGAGTWNGSTIDVQATGVVTIDSSGGTISIGADDDDFAVNVGTTGVRTITVGNSLATEVQVDALLVDINAGATGMSVESAATIDLQATSNLTIDSSGGSIGIGTDSAAGAINVGTAGVRTITVGNATSTEVELNAVLLDVNGGTGGVSIETAATTGAVSSGAISLVTGATSGTAVSGGIEILTGDSVEDTGDILISSGATVVATKAPGDVTIRIGRGSTAGTGFLRLAVTTDAGTQVEPIQIYRDDGNGENVVTMKHSTDTIFRIPNTSSAAPGEGAIRVLPAGGPGGEDVLQWYDDTVADAWVDVTDFASGSSLQDVYDNGTDANIDTSATRPFTYTIAHDDSEFSVISGTDNFTLDRSGANVLNLTAAVNTVDINASGAVTIDTDTPAIDVASQPVTITTGDATGTGNTGAITLEAGEAGGTGISGNVALKSAGYATVTDTRTSAAAGSVGYFRGDWVVQSFTNVHENIAAGDVVFLLNVGGVLKAAKAKADNTAAYDGKFIGIAAENATAGAGNSVYVIRSGSQIPVNTSDTWTTADLGELCYLSGATAGEVADASPITTQYWISVVGYITGIASGIGNEITLMPFEPKEIL